MVLNIEGLRFAYGRQPLYEGLGVVVRQPGIYGFFGRNGSGKSTLLKLLAGLLTPAAGQLAVLGHEPRRRAPGFLAQVYLLPEEFHLPNLSPLQLRGNQAAFYPAFDAALYDEYLQELQVPAAQRFAEMSLGQKKKAAIAFALATQTPLLLMDEPTNGLDIESRMQFRRLMARPEQAARTVLISTHQAHDLESILTHLWFIDQGRIVLDASMQRVAERVRMGVAASADALPDASELLYQTPVGAQWAWVARIDDAAAPTGAAERAAVQLELLYKALSLAPEAVLAALQDPAEVAA
ncbi:MAG: ABC transporter ATP-binding protein [Ottowia sp.]|nr:ABC transporter ATP-binding protein [Ottowia sp.]